MKQKRVPPLTPAELLVKCELLHLKLICGGQEPPPGSRTLGVGQPHRQGGRKRPSPCGGR